MPFDGTAVNRRKTLKGLGAAITGVSLAGCSGGGGDGGDGGSGGDGGDGGGGDGNGGATTQMQVQDIGVVLPHFGIWSSTVPFLIGTEQGFFEEEGLNPSHVSTEGGGSNIRAVLSGDAAVGHSTGVAGIFAAYREGTGIRMVGNAINQSSDMTFYSMADSGISSVEDLEGKSIGFSSPGSSTNMVAATAASEFGAEAVAVGGPPDANAALETGEVDVAWTTPPFFFEGILGDKYNLVFRGSEVPPFDSLTIRGHFASKQTLGQRSDLVASWFAGWQKAWDWTYDNFEEAIRIYGQATENENYDLLENAIGEGYPESAIQPGDIVGLDAANDLAVNYDFIDSPLSQDEVNELIDTSVQPTTDGDTFS